MLKEELGKNGVGIEARGHWKDKARYRPVGNKAFTSRIKQGVNISNL
jgi:hypothetical protein